MQPACLILNLAFYRCESIWHITVKNITYHDPERQFLCILSGNIAHYSFIDILICKCLKAAWEKNIQAFTLIGNVVFLIQIKNHNEIYESFCYNITCLIRIKQLVLRLNTPIAA